VIPRFKQVDCVIAELDALGGAEIRQSLPQNIDCVFHLAATIAGPDWPPSRYLAANGAGTSAVLEVAEACKARSFVNTSTQLVIGKPERTPFGTDHPMRPESPYALSKLAGEMACELFRRCGRIAATSLRLTSVIGVGMAVGSVLPLFASRALRSETLAYHGAGARVQNFVHVDDVVRACVLAAGHPGSGVLIAGGADSLSMKDLAGLVVRLTPGSTSRVTASGRPDAQDDYRWIPELEPARAAVGYAPCIPLDTFLPEYIESIAHPRPIERWWE
jgi:nucleoside-diphosphate-sugar epimerase